MTSDKNIIETPSRIEPARLDSVPEQIADALAELSASSSKLGHRLHPSTAANLSGLVRIMNTYYSNLIEGHNTRPRDIERALSGDFDTDDQRRNLQLEAAAHVRIQIKLEQEHLEGRLGDPTSIAFIKKLHEDFYKDAPAEMLIIKSEHTEFIMEPGEWRSDPKHDVIVGRHIPPSSQHIADFMSYFEGRYRFETMGAAAKILAIPAVHHRFNYIHPFPDGNGRVSRLMSHAMALKAGIGAHGLWSISRGLARGLESRKDYKMKMDAADMPRQGDLDGRGNLSLGALQNFTLWFLKVCIDQVVFMSDLFDLDGLSRRYERLVERNENLKPETFFLFQEALIRGQFDRGEATRITGLPERSARRILKVAIETGLLGSDTPKGPVSLRFPSELLEDLFPRLYPES